MSEWKWVNKISNVELVFVDIKYIAFINTVSCQRLYYPCTFEKESSTAIVCFHPYWWLHLWWLCLSLPSMTVRPCIWPCSCWHDFLLLVDYVSFFFLHFFFIFIKQRVTLTFKVLPSRHHTHPHACLHMCCPQG